MAEENDLMHDLEIILVQLKGLENLLNNSINHTDKANLTYPTVSKRYNQILTHLKGLANRDPSLAKILAGLNNFEEKDFLKYENYYYAVELQTTIRFLISDLRGFGSYQVKEVTQSVGVPTVFVSYATEELALADFIKAVLNRWTEKKIEVFIAKRDLKSGDNPLGVMEIKLKTAYSIIPICSKKAKINSWVWWEAAAVWGTGHRVHPLFTNISPDEFGAPLTLFTQGKKYFVKNEFVDTLETVCNKVGINIDSADFNSEELKEYKKLSEEYTKEETSAKVEIGYKILTEEEEFHKYSLNFDIINRSNQKFENLILEIYFPLEYLERKEWNYAYLQSSVSKEKPEYLCLTFDFSALNEKAKTQFSRYLLPGKKLRIFGEDGMTRLHYEMDQGRWWTRTKYEIQWRVYINNGAPQEGSTSLDALQIF